MPARTAILIFLLPLSAPMTALAQPQRDVAPLKYWPAPLYWQPSQSERLTRPEIFEAAQGGDPPATTPTGSLVFVGMTPCRLVDTRTGFGFTGSFGPPSLSGGAIRPFPLQTSSTCSVPSTARAYSLNVTIVPPGPMGYLTVWPLGSSQPNVSTLNDPLGTIIANAAIVPAGSDGSGSVNVFASNNTDLIIDINGYYAPQTGITLAQGAAGTPSLSFSGDAGTGVYSSGAGTVNIATNGTNRVTVASNGNLSANAGATITGTNGDGAVVTARRSGGDAQIIIDASPVSQNSSLSYRKNNVARWLAYADGSPEIGLNNGSNFRLDAYNDAGTSLATALFVQRSTGAVGIGTSTPGAQLGAETSAFGRTAIYGKATGSDGTGVSGYASADYGAGVWGSVTGNFSTAVLGSGGANSVGVQGESDQNLAVAGYTTSGTGVYGDNGDSNTIGHAGYFNGRVHVTGNLIVDGTFSNPSDARLKQQIEPLGYGLPELLRLRPVTWKWKAEPDGPPQLGLVAQDVERVLPELVQHDADPSQPLSLNYLGLVPVSIKAIQDQQAQIADQKQQLVELKEELAAIKALLNHSDK